MIDRTKAVVLLSGGIDSAVALWELLQRNPSVQVVALSFDYGQTLEREGVYAAQQVNRARRRWPNAHMEFLSVDLDLSRVCPRNSILGGAEITTGRTADDIARTCATPSSYVPFRNGIFFAMAASLAESRQWTEPFLVAGCNGLASGNYWDDSEQFGRAMEVAINAGTAPEFRPRLWLPNTARTKAQVVARGLELGVPMELTYSCYAGGPEHCGVCDSCVVRAAAMSYNGLNLDGYST